jgi:peptide/nickel transport system permease protein
MTDAVPTSPPDAAIPAPAAAPGSRPQLSLVGRALDSDLWASFKRSKVTMLAAFFTLLFFLAAILAGLVSPQDPFDPAQLELLNSRIPPLWADGGQAPFLLGTDQQGSVSSPAISAARSTL